MVAAGRACSSDHDGGTQSSGSASARGAAGHAVSSRGSLERLSCAALGQAAENASEKAAMPQRGERRKPNINIGVSNGATRGKAQVRVTSLGHVSKQQRTCLPEFRRA